VTLNDPELVRREYADDSRFAIRASAWESAVGPDPRELALQAVGETGPRRVVEVGCGRGEASERIARELGAEVVAIDQSKRMVELARTRGVDARVGDVQDLTFDDGSFDCALAAWMLYHVSDLDRGLAELARVLRPGGRLVAVTNAARNLPELWDALGVGDVGLRAFSAETGAEALRRHFLRVERRVARGTLTFPDREAVLRYVENSISRAHLIDRLPEFDGPFVCTRLTVVFAAEKPE
jgi:ubiquinone/menaquinone biosynthesis C-methylase UbiE